MSYIVINEDRCKGCGLCTLACPRDLVQISDSFNAKGYRPAVLIDPEGQCTGCVNCASMCPDVAIVVYRTRKPAQGTRVGEREAVSAMTTGGVS